MKRIALTMTACVLVAALAAGCYESESPTTPAAPRAKKLCTLSDLRINESSGLAPSPSAAGVFWTHNDSGDGPRIYAVNKQGLTLGVYTLEGAKNRDWEDMASYTLDGMAYLLLADVGDNSSRYSEYQLYVVPEPEIKDQAPGEAPAVKPEMVIRFTYRDKSRDCEAVAVDAIDRKIYLMSKRENPQSVFELPLPRTQPDESLKAKKIARVQLPHPTAMDMSPDGRRAIVLTYSHAWEYTRGDGQDWAEAFGRNPRRIVMPQLPQGEGICYGAESKHIYATSEKLPTPLWEIMVTEPQD